MTGTLKRMAMLVAVMGSMLPVAGARVPAAETTGPAAAAQSLPSGVDVRGPEKPSAIEEFALAELRAALSRSASGRTAQAPKLSLVIGQPGGNAEVKRLLDSGFAKPETRKEGYALKYDKDKGVVLVAGTDDRGALYGVMDLIHYRLADVLAGKAESFEAGEAPKLDCRGIWGWGGGIKNYEKFFDQMARWKMNLCIPWHKKVPKNAKAFQDYAASRGVYIAWGYTWGWPRIDWKDDATVTKTSDTAIATFKEQYAPLKPWGIYFQSHTEYGAGGPWGAKWIHLVNRTSQAIFEIKPDVKIFAGMHGNFRNHQEHIKNLDARVDMMYEDLPSASHYVAAACSTRALSRNKELVAIRGDQEKVGYVYKGFTQAMTGGDPGLEDDAQLKSKANARWAYWAMNEWGWREYFAGWNEVLKDLAESKAERKSVTLLIEGALWEYQAWWAGCLLAEALWNPSRDPGELIKTLDACPYAVSAIRTHREPKPSQVVKHAAIGKPVKMKTPFPGLEVRDRSGPTSVAGAAGLVDGVIAVNPKQGDYWLHGLPSADFEAVIDMEQKTVIKEVQARFLQNPTYRRNTVAPANVEVAVSSDGADFKVVATIKSDSADKGMKTYTAAGLEATARYVRVRADKTAEKEWLFTDEILVNPAAENQPSKGLGGGK